MSKKPSSSSDLANLSSLSPGETLCRARKEKGLSAEEVMLHLGITQRTLNALEHDEYDLLPSPLYVKGYIKRYCSILGISDTTVLAGFETQVNELGLGNNKEPVIRLDGPNEGRAFGWKTIILIVVAIMLVVFAWVYLSDSNDGLLTIDVTEQPASLFEGVTELPSANAPVLEYLPEDGVLESTTTSTSKNRTDLTKMENGNVDIQYEAVQQKNRRPQTTDTPTATVSIASDANVLQVSVTQQSWIEILDAKGDILLADLKTSGYEGEVKGMAPFNVILGYAPGVKLTLNGKKIEIPSIGNDNTAKLKIGDKKER